jgi:hypothetical protein
MSPVTKGAWRSVRVLLLVICAGGILAADNSWISAVNADLLNPNRWFSSAAANDAVEASAAVNFPVDLAPRARMSMDGLLHGLLFERPAGRWAFNSRAVEGRSSLARRLVEFDQINPISGGDNSFAYRMAASFAPIVEAPPAVTAHSVASPTVPSAPTASGTWNANASGNWGNSGNWSGGVVADGAGNTASFNTLDITTDVTVTLDTSRTIGAVFIGDTDETHRYIIAPSGGSSLTFDSGVPFGSSELQQSSTSAGDIIAVNLFLNSSLEILNSSATNPLTISGNISSTAPSAFLNVGIDGTVNVSGNISDGTTGTQISLSVSSGVTTLTGTNTYTGSTFVNGTLLVNGNNSGATETVFVSGGVLGGTGTIGGTVMTFDGTITGGTTTNVGALTLLQNLDLSTDEGTGTYLANLSGNMSDLLAITGSLSLGAGSILDIDGTGDGITTYTLATFDDRNNTTFETVSGIPFNYTLVYHDMDIQLVPIPEPSTWIGGALVFAALAFTQRRRLRKSKT